jgi:uncharacterized RDD family membrane protein YckC
MGLPPRQSWFLRVAAAIAAALLLCGAWEFALSRALHDLVCGVAVLMFVLLARRQWRAA